MVFILDMPRVMPCKKTHPKFSYRNIPEATLGLSVQLEITDCWFYNSQVTLSKYFNLFGSDL